MRQMLVVFVFLVLLAIFAGIVGMVATCSDSTRPTCEEIEKILLHPTPTSGW